MSELLHDMFFYVALNKSSVASVFRLAMLLSHVLTIAVDPVFVVVMVLDQH